MGRPVVYGPPICSSPSRKGTQFHITECDGELLILQSDVPVGEFRVADVEGRLAVQHHDDVIAVGGHLRVFH